MYMTLKFGDKEYEVTNYSVSVGTVSGDSKLANAVPGEISMNLDLPPSANPADGLLGFAQQQHSVAKDKGSGTLTIFKDKDVEQGLQEITFEQGWITDLDMSTSEVDDRFSVGIRIAAAKVVVSGVPFEHRGRGEHFSK